MDEQGKSSISDQAIIFVDTAKPAIGGIFNIDSRQYNRISYKKNGVVSYRFVENTDTDTS